MRRLAFVPCLLALVAGARPAHARGGFLPPLEIEVGESAIAQPGGDVRATQIIVGLSSASIYPHPTRFDVSIGWLGSFLPAPAPDDAPVAGRVVGESTPTGHDASGAFLALDLRAASGKHWRAWLGGRGELLDSGDTGVLGGVGRASIELWHPVMEGGSGGVLMGTLALSAWMELGARERPEGGLGRVASAGIGLRLPLVVVAR